MPRSPKLTTFLPLPPTASPSETLAKILTISHKLALVTGPIQPGSPVARAFEAAKVSCPTVLPPPTQLVPSPGLNSPLGSHSTRSQTALILANRHWISQGPRALGPLGQIGSASTPDAIAAWTKATDGKVKAFDNGQGAALHHGPAIDAGRLVGPRHGEPELGEAPPMYEAPPERVADPAGGESDPAGAGTEAAAEAVVHEGEEAAATHQTNGVREAVREAVVGSPNRTSASVAGGARRQSEIDLEQGRANLARLRQALIDKQAAAEVASHQSSQRPPDHDGLESDVSTPDHRDSPPPAI